MEFGLHVTQWGGLVGGNGVHRRGTATVWPNS